LGFFTDLNPATGQWCEEHNPRTPKVIEEMAQFINSLDLEVLALEEVEDAEALDLLLSFMLPGKYAYIVSPKPRRRPASGWPSSTTRTKRPYTTQASCAADTSGLFRRLLSFDALVY
jgi:hypothetical protein